MCNRLLISALAASILLTGTPAIAAKALYRWTDEKGVVHYSDTKPRDSEFERREIPTDPVPAGAAETAEAKAEPAPADAKPTPKAGPSADCLLARSNLETLKGAAAVSMDTDGDGVPETLEGDARQLAVANASELAQKLCAP